MRNVLVSVLAALGLTSVALAGAAKKDQCAKMGKVTKATTAEACKKEGGKWMMAGKTTTTETKTTTNTTTTTPTEETHTEGTETEGEGNQ